jgi:hypothetical protein
MFSDRKTPVSIGAPTSFGNSNSAEPHLPLLDARELLTERNCDPQFGPFRTIVIVLQRMDWWEPLSEQVRGQIHCLVEKVAVPRGLTRSPSWSAPPSPAPYDPVTCGQDRRAGVATALLERRPPGIAY